MQPYRIGADLNSYLPAVKKIPKAAAPIIQVAAQPRTLSCSGSFNFPITFGLLAISIMKHITGTAVIPLMMADHTRAWIGLIFVKLSASPKVLAIASTA